MHHKSCQHPPSGPQVQTTQRHKTHNSNTTSSPTMVPTFQASIACDFEFNHCGWIDSAKQRWSRYSVDVSTRQGILPSTSKHEVALVLDTRVPSVSGWTSNLTSPVLRGERFLSFHYRVPDGTLRLEALTSNAPTHFLPVWWTHDDTVCESWASAAPGQPGTEYCSPAHGSGWHMVSLELPPNALRLRFVGVAGVSPEADIEAARAAALARANASYARSGVAHFESFRALERTERVCQPCTVSDRKQYGSASVDPACVALGGRTLIIGQPRPAPSPVVCVDKSLSGIMSEPCGPQVTAQRLCFDSLFGHIARANCPVTCGICRPVTASTDKCGATSVYQVLCDCRRCLGPTTGLRPCRCSATTKNSYSLDTLATNSEYDAAACNATCNANRSSCGTAYALLLQAANEKTYVALRAAYMDFVSNQTAAVPGAIVNAQQYITIDNIKASVSAISGRCADDHTHASTCAILKVNPRLCSYTTCEP